jgi:glycerophosphoryl diester phosphodiesterase
MPEAKPRPLVIAHRGASGERPEHTMGAYRLAIAEGADYIEPDLVMTKDGVLVCRHENEISGTTDVEDHGEFARRRTDKVVDGAPMSGWFVEDFTLDELKTLRCRERLPQLRPQNAAFNGQEAIPTFDEVLALAHGSHVGVYPEMKHPTFLEEQGLDPVAPLVRALEGAGWNGPGAPVLVQCFEAYALRRFGGFSSVRKIQLLAADSVPWDLRDENVTLAGLLSDTGLADMAAYAFGIGVEKTLVIPRAANDSSAAPTDLVTRAHRIGLAVHAWTFRAENTFLPAEWRRGDPAAANYGAEHGNLAAELTAFFEAGVDGAFCDFPAIARAAADHAEARA